MDRVLANDNLAISDHQDRGIGLMAKSGAREARNETPLYEEC